MKLTTRFLSTAAAAVALLAAGQAQADTTWAWSYTGDGVIASGTFTTAGNAAVPEDILTFGGTRNGVPILGLIPVGEAENFIYDNQFFAAAPHFSDGGLVFDVGGGDAGIVNIYYWEDDLATYDLRVINGFAVEVPITFSVSAVPEAATYAYMALGLAGLGIAARRRKAA